MRHAPGLVMNTRSMLLVLGLGLAVGGLGCQVSITDGEDDDCDGPQPAVGSCGQQHVCIDGEWVEEEGDFFCAPCPQHQPSDGAACEILDQACEYEEEIGCDYEPTIVTARCTEDGWFTAYGNCQPEPECPESLPTAGTDCSSWPYAYWCSYPTNCGSDVQMHCESTAEGQVWVVDSAPSCEGSCSDAGDSASCGLFAGCQWLEPGCSDLTQSPIAAGCYPLDDCTTAPASCGPEEQCSAFIYDPCFGQKCDACGAEYSLCVSGQVD